MSRRIALLVYAAAVVASAAYQTARPGVPGPNPTDRAVVLEPQTATGPVAGAPVRLVYEDDGAGPPVVLLHGSPGAIADFRHLSPHLTSRFRVLVPDLPGFGRSSRWPPDYSVAAHARYVLAWLDALGVREFQAVGFSQGGGVALHLAELAPGRVRSVALVGGIGIQEGEGSGSYRLEHAKYLAMVPTVVAGPELVPHFGWLGSRSFRWTFFRNFHDTDQRPLRNILTGLRVPLLVLHGRHDPLVPAWAAAEHHRLAPAGELHLFDDSHFMLFDADKTARLAAPLAAFLGAHADRSAGASEGKRAVAYGPDGRPRDGSALPERELWPARAQVGVPLAVALAWPAGGALLAGGLTGTDRADWFAAGLGACVGGVVRQRRAGWAARSFGLTAALAVATAAVGWSAVVLAVFGWAGWSAWRVRRPTATVK